MRVLIALHQFFPESRAGTEVLALGLARALADAGEEVSIFAARRSAPFSDLSPYEVTDYEWEGIPVRRCGRPAESADRPYRLNYDEGRMAFALADYARQRRAQVVHFMHLQGLSAAAIPAIKALGLPAVFTATDFWAVCPVVDLRRHDGKMCTGPDPAHCPRCLVSRQPHTKVNELALKIPGPLWRAAGALAPRLPDSALPAPVRQVGDLDRRPQFVVRRVNMLDAILAPTRLMATMLVGNGVRPELVRHSPYGIDASHIPPRRGSAHSPPHFAFSGTLAPHKGVDTLVRAARSLPPAVEFTLDIHGPDREEWYRKELERLAATDPRIRFRGPFPRERLGDVLTATDVLVVPSRWYENSPVVVYEAFAAGVPVVATDLGGMSEVVEHGKNGLLFALDDVEGLARALEGLATEPGLIERLRRGVRPPRTVEDAAAEAREIYRDLVERNGEL